LAAVLLEVTDAYQHPGFVKPKQFVQEIGLDEGIERRFFTLNMCCVTVVLDLPVEFPRFQGLFEPVVVGDLKSAKKFDPGTSVFGQALTAKELRQRLGL